MKTIVTLSDLLLYSVQQLHQAEGFIEEFLKNYSIKATHRSLKNALIHHAGLTEAQKKRLKKITQFLDKNELVSPKSMDVTPGRHGIIGIEGLIEEGRILLGMDISKEVIDTAIIAAVQKLEHYEICSYGTMLAYAKQLHLHAVEELLKETLQEEYDMNDLLTSLAIAAINKEAVPRSLAGLTNEPAETKGGFADQGSYVHDHPPVSITERSIKSPGGRAGTSHRGYSTGESRGH